MQVHLPKISVVLLKNFSSRTVTDVPTVDNDWGFLFAVMTIIGISLEKTKFEKKVKYKIIKNLKNILNILSSFTDQ